MRPGDVRLSDPMPRSEDDRGLAQGEQLIDVLGPGESEGYDDLSAKLGLDERRLIDRGRWTLTANAVGGLHDRRRASRPTIAACTA
jgi:hypothetical protein